MSSTCASSSEPEGTSSDFVSILRREVNAANDTIRISHLNRSGDVTKDDKINTRGGATSFSSTSAKGNVNSAAHGESLSTYIAGIGESSSCGILVRAQSGVLRGQADLQGAMLAVEHECAELREECTLRGARIEALEALVKKEATNTLRLTTSRNAEVEEVREMMERQQQDLYEQLAVLRGAAESALVDKRRVDEELSQLKQQFSRQLQDERAARQRLLTDYRLETEAFIGEQGNEIAGLRQLLDSAKNEETKLLQLLKEQAAVLKEVEEKLANEQNERILDKSAAEKRLKAVELAGKKALRDEQEAAKSTITRLENEIDRLTREHDKAIAEARSVTARVQALQMERESERLRLRSSYEDDLRRGEEETRRVSERAERAAQDAKLELEKVTAASESTVSALRRQLEQLRREKAEAIASAAEHMDAELAGTKRQIQQLQENEIRLNRTIEEERVASRDALARTQSSEATVVSLQEANVRLTGELEEVKVQARVRERDLAQRHNKELSALEDHMRATAKESAQLQNQLRKVDIELQRLLDEAEEKQREVDDLKRGVFRAREDGKEALAQARRQADDAKRVMTAAIELLQSEKTELEAERRRMQQQLAESESRLAAAQRQAEDERNALDAVMSEATSLRAQLGSSRHKLREKENERERIEADLKKHMEDAELLQGALKQVEEALEVCRDQLDSERDERRVDALSYDERQKEVMKQHSEQLAQRDSEINALNERITSLQSSFETAEKERVQLRQAAKEWEGRAILAAEESKRQQEALQKRFSEELIQMDTVLNSARQELNEVKNAKISTVRNAADAAKEADFRIEELSHSLFEEKAARLRAQEDVKRASNEASSVLSVWKAQMKDKDEEIQRLKNELKEYSSKLYESEMEISKREAKIGSLNARLYMIDTESKG